MVDVRGLGFGYDRVAVISDLSLGFEQGAVTSIMGPSGCGKTTLLRLLASLEVPIYGTCQLRSQGGIDPALRYLFQDFDALPWLTVEANLKLGGRNDSPPSPSWVDELLNRLGLAAFRRNYPGELSGGLRKRVALGRCLVAKPELILMDEPFSSLDVATKSALYDFLQALWLEEGTTVLIVTHDIHEAILMSSRIIVSSKRPFRIVSDFVVPLAHPRTFSSPLGTDYLLLHDQITGALLASAAGSSSGTEARLDA